MYDDKMIEQQNYITVPESGTLVKIILTRVEKLLPSRYL